MDGAAGSDGDSVTIVRNYGITYDTGMTADGDCTRKHFDDAVVRRELQIIAADLHPHRDLDLASYGVVAVLDHGRGTTYPDMTWEPKQVFGALAAAYARARP